MTVAAAVAPVQLAQAQAQVVPVLAPARLAALVRAQEEERAQVQAAQEQEPVPVPVLVLVVVLLGLAPAHPALVLATRAARASGTPDGASAWPAATTRPSRSWRATRHPRRSGRRRARSSSASQPAS